MLFGFGLILVCFAVGVSNSSYPEILLGENAKDLSWGPTLFRVLLIFHGVLLIVVGLTWNKFETGKSEKQNVGLVNESSKIGGLVLAVMVFLSVATLILRLWRLNTDLWVDEVLTLIGYARKPFGEILTSFPDQNQHMLYSFLAHTSFEIFGESAWALRLPSVIFGVGSIWAMFFLARKLLGVKEALLASALMTFSYHHVWFSQNARGYMGLLFFTLLATWFWFEALEKNRWGWWLAYSAAIVLGMWVHMTMAFVVATHGLVYLAMILLPKLSGGVERSTGIRPWVAWFLSVTVTLQLYALALPEFLRVALHEESKNSEWTNPIWVLTETIQNLSIGFAGIAVVICGGAFVAFGWLSLLRKNLRAAVLMILPPILAGIFMLSVGHNLFPRFFFFAMGFGLIIVIHGAIELPKVLFGFINKSAISNQQSAIPNALGVAMVMLVILASLTTVPRNYALPKQNYSAARDYVENNRQPEDRIIAVSLAGMMYSKLFAPHWSAADSGAELENIQQKGGKIWLIYTLSPEIKAFHPDMWEMIEKDYEIVKVFPGTLNGGEIFVCQKRITNEEKNESSRNFNQSKNDFIREQTAQK